MTGRWARLQRWNFLCLVYARDGLYPMTGSSSPQVLGILGRSTAIPLATAKRRRTRMSPPFTDSSTFELELNPSRAGAGYTGAVLHCGKDRRAGN